VVVEAGLTDLVPPVAVSVYEEPSLPVTTTFVALAATTVNVDELPAVMEDGAAEMLTVAAGRAVTVTDVRAVADPFEPVAVAV
jgi:hypothetical protein